MENQVKTFTFRFNFNFRSLCSWFWKLLLHAIIHLFLSHTHSFSHQALFCDQWSIPYRINTYQLTLFTCVSRLCFEIQLFQFSTSAESLVLFAILLSWRNLRKYSNRLAIVGNLTSNRYIVIFIGEIQRLQTLNEFEWVDTRLFVCLLMLVNCKLFILIWIVYKSNCIILDFLFRCTISSPLINF